MNSMRSNTFTQTSSKCIRGTCIPVIEYMYSRYMYPQSSSKCIRGTCIPSYRVNHRSPFVGAFQGRSWSHWVVLGAILWAFIVKIDKISRNLTSEIPPRRALRDVFDAQMAGGRAAPWPEGWFGYIDCIDIPVLSRCIRCIDCIE